MTPDDAGTDRSRPDGDKGAEDDEAKVFVDRLRGLLPRTGTDFDLGLAIVKVLEPVDHLRQYVAPLLEHLAILDDRNPVEAVDALFTGSFPSPERRSELRALVDQGEADLAEHLEGTTFPVELMSVDLEAVLADLGGFVAQLTQSIDPYEIMLAQLARARTMTLLEQTYLVEYAMTRHRIDHRNLLLRGVAIMATSLVQPYIGDLLTVVIREEGKIARAPLARDEIDRQVRKLLTAGPSQWHERLTGRLGVPALEVALDWDEFDGIWELRNLLVHRGGVVDAPYRARHPTAPPVGSNLDMTEPQIEALFDFAGLVRFALVVATAERLNPGKGAQLAGEHFRYYWGQFERGHWRLARGIAETATAFAANSHDQEIARCNVWIAAEQDLGWDAIRPEVEAWHPAGPLFRMARAVLLHHDDLAVQLANDLLGSGEITIEQVSTFPLFKRLRDLGRLP